jgi:hypothetical protein
MMQTSRPGSQGQSITSLALSTSSLCEQCACQGRRGQPPVMVTHSLTLEGQVPAPALPPTTQIDLSFTQCVNGTYLPKQTAAILFQQFHLF